MFFSACRSFCLTSSVTTWISLQVDRQWLTAQPHKSVSTSLKHSIYCNRFRETSSKSLRSRCRKQCIHFERRSVSFKVLKLKIIRLESVTWKREVHIHFATLTPSSSEATRSHSKQLQNWHPKPASFLSCSALHCQTKRNLSVANLQASHVSCVLPWMMKT